MTEIVINIRNIPEVSTAFHTRPNKKDSFTRWFKNNHQQFSFRLAA